MSYNNRSEDDFMNIEYGWSSSVGSIAASSSYVDADQIYSSSYSGPGSYNAAGCDELNHAQSFEAFVLQYSNSLSSNSNTVFGHHCPSHCMLNTENTAMHLPPNNQQQSSTCARPAMLTTFQQSVATLYRQHQRNQTQHLDYRHHRNIDPNHPRIRRMMPVPFSYHYAHYLPVENNSYSTSRSGSSSYPLNIHQTCSSSQRTASGGVYCSSTGVDQLSRLPTAASSVSTITGVAAISSSSSASSSYTNRNLNFPSFSSTDKQTFNLRKQRNLVSTNTSCAASVGNSSIQHSRFNVTPAGLNNKYSISKHRTSAAVQNHGSSCVGHPQPSHNMSECCQNLRSTIRNYPERSHVYPKFEHENIVHYHQYRQHDLQQQQFADNRKLQLKNSAQSTYCTSVPSASRASTLVSGSVGAFPSKLVDDHQPPLVLLSVLLPNGLFFDFSVDYETTLTELKQLIWHKLSEQLDDGPNNKENDSRNGNSGDGSFYNKIDSNESPTDIPEINYVTIPKGNFKKTKSIGNYRLPFAISRSKSSIIESLEDQEDKLSGSNSLSTTTTITNNSSAKLSRSRFGSFMQKFRRNSSSLSSNLTVSSVNNQQTTTSIESLTSASSSICSSMPRDMTKSKNNESNAKFGEEFEDNGTTSINSPSQQTCLLSSKTFALEDLKNYVFVGISCGAKHEEYFEDKNRIAELNLFLPILKMVDAIGSKSEKHLNFTISSIIGKQLTELDEIDSTEFHDYRQNMHHYMVQDVQFREALQISEKIEYEFPPDLDEIETLSLSTQRLKDLNIFELFASSSTPSTGVLEEPPPTSPPPGNPITFPNKNNLDRSTSRSRSCSFDSLNSFDSFFEDSVRADVGKKDVQQEQIDDERPELNCESSQKQCIVVAGNDQDVNSVYTEVIALPFDDEHSTSTAVVPSGGSTNYNYNRNYSNTLGDISVEATNTTTKNNSKQTKINKKSKSKQLLNNFANSTNNSSENSMFRKLKDDVDQQPIVGLVESETSNTTDSFYNFSIWASLNCITNPQAKISAAVSSNSKNLVCEISSNFDQKPESVMKDSVSCIVESDSDESEYIQISTMGPSGIGSANESHSNSNELNNQKLYSNKKGNLLRRIFLKSKSQVENDQPVFISISNPSTDSSSSVSQRALSTTSGDLLQKRLSLSHSESSVADSTVRQYQIDNFSLNSHPPKLIDSLLRMMRSGQNVEDNLNRPAKGRHNSLDSSNPTQQQQSQQPQHHISGGKSFGKLLSGIPELIGENYSRLIYSTSGSSSSSVGVESVSGQSSSDQSNKQNTRCDNKDRPATPCMPSCDDFLLKICGYQQYLVGSYPLICFEYIRKCISKGKTPQMVLIPKQQIVAQIPEYLYVMPYFLRRLSGNNGPNPKGPNDNSNTNECNNNFSNNLSGPTKIITATTDMFVVKTNFYPNKMLENPNNNSSSNNSGRKLSTTNNPNRISSASTKVAANSSGSATISSSSSSSKVPISSSGPPPISRSTSKDAETNYAVICATASKRNASDIKKSLSNLDETSKDTGKVRNKAGKSTTVPSSTVSNTKVTSSTENATKSTRSQHPLNRNANMSKSNSNESSLASQTSQQHNSKTKSSNQSQNILEQNNFEVQSLDSWIEEGISSRSLISLWKINTVFRVRVLLATYVNVKDVDRIYVRAGIYHCGEPLCQLQTTRQVHPQNPRWDEMLEFNGVCIQDLPQTARLSIALCAVVTRKRQQEEYAISWVNLQLFNYRRCLMSGRISVNLWPMPQGYEVFLNPTGVSGSNPNRYSSPRLQIEFDTFPKPIVYPPHSNILDYAQIVNKQEAKFRQKLKQLLEQEHEGNLGPLLSPLGTVTETLANSQLASSSATNSNGSKLSYLSFFEKCSVNRFVRNSSRSWMIKQLRKLVLRRDPFAELSEQEKDFFWRERHIIRKIVPDALPKVLESVRWSCREEVCQIYAMLDKWPLVSVDTAIILLGARFVDTEVRKFAIKCLDKGLTDSLMLHYLLQFIQLLKGEPYHDCDLARLLLRRALLNRRFGHLFFWHLRSQIHERSTAARWCVLLEMYCRGLTQTSLEATLKQVKALEEIERTSNETINDPDRRESIMKQFTQSQVLSKINCFSNPLDISLELGDLIHDKCRVMDSAKRPLWLEWTNPDQLASLNRLEMSAIIFKSGDDLRQDMLTLQLIRIMDLIWRRENLDLKMLPYNCLATGDQVGLIEVVSHAKTVMGIQRCGGRMAALQVDSSKLHKWIKDHNPDTYDSAVDNFTRSCAGYCVATFILGIGDRNPDNIMVNEDGQIFHIDFGHFLGHFKKKFGINRERVPFVLTYDFLQVIGKGAENPLKSKEFESFQRLCYEAYLALHDNAHLLISLFAMMLGTGIPELQTLEDVQYLCQTLRVNQTREEALQYFDLQLDEAHGGAWSTKLDWFFHSVKHA